MTEMNACLGGRGGFFSKEKFKYFSRNCVWVPCLQMEKSQSCRLTNSSSLFLVFKVLSHVSISAAWNMQHKYNHLPFTDKKNLSSGHVKLLNQEKNTFRGGGTKPQSSVPLDHSDTFMRIHLGQGTQIRAEERTCRSTTLKHLINIISNNRQCCTGLHSQLPAWSTFLLHLGPAYLSLFSKGKWGKLGMRQRIPKSFVWTHTTGGAAKEMPAANGLSRGQQCYSLLLGW